MTTVIEGAETPSVAPDVPLTPTAAPLKGRDAGAAWRISPVGPADRPALDALFALCSPESVRLRFFGAPRALPAEYTAALLAARPDHHDAVIAYVDEAGPPDGMGTPYAAGSRYGSGSPCEAGQPYETGPPYGTGARPIGLASLATAGGSDPLTAEIGVLVGDDWQRQGAGTAMLAALLDRARARGVERVVASVLPGRAALLRGMALRLGLVPAMPPGPEAPPAVTYEWTGDGLTAVYRLRPTIRNHCAAAPHPQGGPR